MKAYLILLLLTIIFLNSCKKEYSTENGTLISGPVLPGDSLLAKELIQTNNDSSVYLFGYDINRRIISQAYIDYPQSTSPYHEQFTLARNTIGIITREVIKDDSLLASGIDSLVYIIHYDQSNSRYTYETANISIGSFNVVDSGALTYDASGNIISLEHFYVNGSNFQPAFKTTYAYDATGSISDVQQYNFDNNSQQYVLISEDKFQFDLKINPLKYTIEAFLFDDPIRFSKYNAISDNYIDDINPSNNYILTSTYNYNPQNKPVSATGTDSFGDVYTYQFYYQ